MRVDLVGRPPRDVNAAAVGPPAWDAGGKVFVSVRNTPVVLFLVFILRCVRSRVAAQPELLDKLIALFVIRKLLERRQFLRRDDVANVFVKPLLVGRTQLLLGGLGICLFLLRGKPAVSRDQSAGLCFGRRRKRHRSSPAGWAGSSLCGRSMGVPADCAAGAADLSFGGGEALWAMATPAVKHPANSHENKRRNPRNFMCTNTLLET